MENKHKRKRTPNFTAEEKLRFVRLLSEEGQCIISKITAHDATSNKEKEQTWKKIAQIHSSGGDMMRTTKTLKKLWGKLKSEAKTYKATSRHSVTGTGVGPHKKFEDPVLDLVVEITGRASTGILNIDDCDAVADEDTINERTNTMKQQQQVINRFAAERLRAEQEKTNLIMQQTKQNAELHNIKMENERLKKELLQTLLKKVQDVNTKDAVQVATQFTEID